MAIFHSIWEAAAAVRRAGGGERKGTLTGSSSSSVGGQAAARGLTGPGSAGGAAAGCPGGGWGRAHTQPRNAPRRQPAEASAPPLRLGTPPPPTHLSPGTQRSASPTRSTLPFNPYPTPPPNSTHCALGPPRAPPARALHPVHTHAL